MVSDREIATVEDLRDAFASQNPMWLQSTNSHREFRVTSPAPGQAVTMAFSGVISHRVDDQVVTCRANTSIVELQQELRDKGQCLPYWPMGAGAGRDMWSTAGTVAGHLSMNLPHSFEAGCGTWTNWLLGARVVLPTGLEAKCGSSVVKSVAGYDIHRFLIGSRGCLSVFTELVLRTWPLRALPEPDLKIFGSPWPVQGMIQRTDASDFNRVVSEWDDLALAVHPATSTLYARFDPNRPKRRSIGDWVMGWGRGEDNLEIPKGAAATYFRRAKSLFDPEGRLNPGELREI